MTPIQDTIALVVAASAGVLLFASVPAHDLSKAIESAASPPLASVRELCEEDLAKLCADAVIPQETRACLQDNVKQLKAACRLALESPGTK